MKIIFLHVKLVCILTSVYADSMKYIILITRQSTTNPNKYDIQTHKLEVNPLPGYRVKSVEVKDA